MQEDKSFAGSNLHLQTGTESEPGKADAETGVFNEQVMAITADNVREILGEYRDALHTEEGLRDAAEKITKLAYLNMSYAFMRTSKMMAFVIIEHEKKISKLQDMCLKMEHLAEYYKSKNSELLSQTRAKLEEYQTAFRIQEAEGLRVRGATESYEYTLDRISKRFDLLERSIESISERPGNLNIAHLMPGYLRPDEYRRGRSLNGAAGRHPPPLEEGYLLGAKVSGGGGRDYLLGKKPIPLSSPVFGPAWLGEYLQEKKSPFGKLRASGRSVADPQASASFGPVLSSNLSFAAGPDTRYEEVINNMEQEFVSLVDAGSNRHQSSARVASPKYPSYY